jgi:hypothetical protein
MDGEGGIDEVRFPNFARLASGSTWYRMYSTQVEQTVLAVPSALSGRTPRAGASPTDVDHENSLVSLLGASHELRVIETVTEMCPPALCGESVRRSRDWPGVVSGVWDLFGQRISTKRTGAFDEAADVPAIGGSSESDDTIASTNVDDPTLARLMSYRSVFRGWIDAVVPGRGPTFDYAHVLLPHQPWLFSADGSGYVNTMQPEWNDDIYTKYSKWHVAVKQARHGLQTQMVDGLIGELLDQLEESGLYDDAMLIVTADHGAAFMEGYHLRGVMGDYANSLEVMSIPLFIKAPGQRVGAVNDANIQNVDLLPILADTAGFRIPWSVD